MTRAEVAKLIGIIRARYPRSVWDADEKLTVEAWHMSLHDVPLEPTLEVMRAWFAESAFPPDPSEIRGKLLAASGVAPEPAEAWRIAQGAIAAFYPGHTSHYEMPDAVRQAIKSIGGLYTLKMSEEPSKDRDAFMRAYATYRKRALSEQGDWLDRLGTPEPKALT